jgi:hypothetical protein
MALTDATAKAAKPRSKPYKMADEKGLFLLVQATGGEALAIQLCDGRQAQDALDRPIP